MCWDGLCSLLTSWATPDWRKLAGETVAFPTCVKALSETGVDLVVIIGSAENPVEGLWPQGTHMARPVTFVEATGRSRETTSDDCSGFAAAVAAGLRGRRADSICGALYGGVAAQSLVAQLPLPAPEILGPARKSVACAENNARNQQLSLGVA